MQKKVRSAIVDDFNVFDCFVYTPPKFHEQVSQGIDTKIYVPRYRAGQPAPVPFLTVWGSLDFPFSIFKQLRRDNRNSVLIPLEQQTFGESPLSLLMVPLLLLFCRIGRIKITLNLQGTIPLSDFSKSFHLLKPGTRVPSLLAKIVVIITYKLIFSLSDRIEVFSRTFLQGVLEYGNYAKKIKQVPMPIEFKKPIKSGNYFLAFGHLVPRKGLEYLIEAWSVMGEQLIIAGRSDRNPEYAKEILDMARKNPNIQTLENLPPEVAENLIAFSKAMVFPYVYSDSISGPLSTGLGYHKPIIATNIGIFKEVPGAYLCKPRDPQSIREAVWAFLFDEFERKIRYQKSAPAG